MIKNIVAAFCALLFLAGCTAVQTNYQEDPSHFEDFERQVGDRVFFTLAGSELSDQAKNTLDRQAAWLKDHEKFNVTVGGHCDERGTREYNIALGEKRADMVKKYLVDRGIAPSRIETVSYGKEKPSVMGNNENAWAQNRRAVTTLR